MNAGRWAQVENLYNAALERPNDTRATYLANVCGDDFDLRREVESLLENDGSQEALIDRPAWEKYGPLDDELQPGTHFGPFEITCKLGHGGMGNVYQGRDTRLKRLVAIKLLRVGRYASEQQRLRFLQEARAASALNHPNVVQIYELQSLAGADCIVMEYTPGRTLAQVLSGDRLKITQALHYATQIADALAAAHAANIVHRDIKPTNIIITDAGIVKILDFGIAQLQAIVPEARSIHFVSPDTKIDAIVGTAAYMSPEQAEGRAVDARSDVFSAGATLYEMFSGRRAFEGDSMLTILSKVAGEASVPLRLLRPEIPRAVERIIHRCLEKNAPSRYAAGDELARDLSSVSRPTGGSALGRWSMAWAVAALLLVTGVAGWLYQHNSHIRWTRTEALPRIRSLMDKDDNPAAFELARIALRYAPEDPDLKQLWSQVSHLTSLATTPPGAKVFYRAFGDQVTLEAGGDNTFRECGDTLGESIHTH